MAYLMIRTLAVAGLAATMLVLGACAKKSTTVNTPGGNVTVEQNAGGQTTTVTSKEGKVTVGKGAVDVASLGLPVYPGAKQDENAMSMTGSSKTGSGSFVMLTTDDPFDKVYDYYKSQMPAGSEKMKVASGDTQMASFQVGESAAKETKSVTISSAKGKTTIQLVHSTNP
jgi:ABC-type enterochelin transport system substrate-binding protein